MLDWQSQEESMFWGSEYYQRGSGVITEVIYRPKAFASIESFGHDDKNTSRESVVFSPRQAQARGSASTRWDAPGGNGMLFPRARRRRKRGLHHQTGGGKPNRPIEESRADANRPRPSSVPSFSHQLPSRLQPSILATLRSTAWLPVFATAAYKWLLHAALHHGDDASDPGSLIAK